MNTPKRGNKYLLFILVYQFALSFLIPILEGLIGRRLFNSQMSIVLLHITLFIIPFCFYLIFTSQRITDVLPLRKISFTNIGLILLMCITIQPLMMVLSGLSTLLFPNNVSVVMSEFYNMPLLIVILATSLTPAITEELTLRGVVLTNYKNIPIRKAALINGVLFGIIHLDLQQFLYAFLLGVMFAYYVYYTKSIFASVIAHFTINFIQTSFAFITFNMIENTETAIDIVEHTSNADLIALITSLSVVALIFTPVCIVIFRAFAYFNKQNMAVELLKSGEYDLAPQLRNTASSLLAMQENVTPDVQSNVDKVFNWPLVMIITIFVLFVTNTLLS